MLYVKRRNKEIELQHRPTCPWSSTVIVSSLFWRRRVGTQRIKLPDSFLSWKWLSALCQRPHSGPMSSNPHLGLLIESFSCPTIVGCQPDRLGLLLRGTCTSHDFLGYICIKWHWKVKILTAIIFFPTWCNFLVFQKVYEGFTLKWGYTGSLW